MSGAHDQLIEAITAKRQDRLIKWNAVARELGMTEGHLRKIRNGDVRITADVAAAIDRFLGRERGVTWAMLAGPSHGDLRPENILIPPDSRQWGDSDHPVLIDAGKVHDDPTDEQLAEMTNREIAELAIRYQTERGPDARRELLRRAKSARDEALDTLVAETVEPNGS